MAHHALEVVGAVHGACGGVDHAGAVDERDGAQKLAVAHLHAQALQEIRAEQLEAVELLRKARDRGGSANVLLSFAIQDHGEAVVSRREPHVLHAAAEKPVDHRRLA